MKTLHFSNIPSKLAGIVLIIGGLAWQTPASAATLQFDFSNAGAFSGQSGQVPSASGVYARAIFNDTALNEVTLTMSVLSGILVDSSAYVNDWYFNLDPSLSFGSVDFYSGVQALAKPDAVEFGINDFYKADGASGGFDLAFHFATANPGQLGQGLTSVYTLTGTGITANSFNFASADQGYLGAVKVQGYGDSVWLGNTTPTCPDCGDIPNVPEPSISALMGLGLLSMAASYRCSRVTV